jgi:predicted  nucleic acid-binding Zn-ribbon protein
MKFALFVAVFTVANGSPVDKVVTLITNLKKTIEGDGQSELKAYDKFACWCEDTLGAKAADMSGAKESIADLQTAITKLGGELGSYSVDIKQLKKDLAQNRASQKESNAVRNKEYNSYDDDKTQGEQCIGALEAAIKVLTGAGTSKTKFLETLQEAKLLSTLGSLRGVIGTSVVRHKVSEQDLNLVRKFIDQPDDFLNAKKIISDLQMGNNPSGDYAPASGQIQGILQGMYDAFTGNLEKDNADEANKQKSFEALMETKKLEEKTLAATLQRAEKDAAEKTKNLADSKSTLDDTKEQLEADDKFFEQTKESCKSKAQAWAERTRLRAEELQGMTSAIAILTSDDAKSTFKGATTTFLQLSSTDAKTAYEHLEALAAKFGGVSLAVIATEVKQGGHFDKVIHMIENMVLKLHAEGKEDIAHRDRCETKQDKNKKAVEDLNFNIDKLKEKIDRMKDVQKGLTTKIQVTKKAIVASEKTVKEMKDQRESDWKDFSQATKDDVAAIALIGEAIASLSKFYKDNNIKQTHLLQAEAKDAPTTWEDDAYGGRKSESGGILSILSMIKQDLESELKHGKDGESAASTNFASDLKAMEDTLDAQMRSKADADSALAEVERQMNYRGEDKDDENTDLDGEKEIETALKKDCDWIKSDFDKRAANRKLEIEGLDEAKNFLAGAVVLPPSASLVKKSSKVTK